MGLERKDWVVRKILRTAIGTVLFLEGLAFFGGVALHLGIPIPSPYVEKLSYSCALAETISGVMFLAAALATAMRPRVAWRLAVASHVMGVASIAWGIVNRGSASLGQPSHHPAMLILLIVVVIALSMPFCRHALENGHRSKRRRRVLQTL
jgi:hypothetical protein